jgi:deoxyribonuclease-4
MIRFGVAGLGGVKQAIANLETYSELGIKACEIAFTYGVYIKNKPDAIKIGKTAKKHDIQLSIHAPYWINLNSADKKIIENSKKRILRSAEVASWLNAKKVVFHCGYYGKMEKNETFQNIKMQISEMQDTIKKNKWDVTLCPEIMGKKNVFGSIDEISRLVKETGCGFCIDFAHVLARYEKYEIEKIKREFPQKQWHCHFSGIEYGKSGEKHHKKTSVKDIKDLLKMLPNNKKITVINESPDPVGDSVLSIRLSKKNEK